MNNEGKNNGYEIGVLLTQTCQKLNSLEVLNVIFV